MTVNAFSVENDITYTENSSIEVPLARNHHAMAYDAESDRIILFGGFDPNTDTIFNDTWVYDYNSNTWINMHPVNFPQARLSPAMTYDSTSDKIILFGGLTVINDQPVEFNDTWAYDYNSNTWANLNPSIAPPARIAHRLTYDSSSDLILLQGGHTPSKNLGHLDIWTYKYSENNWTELSIGNKPTEMDYSLFIYDNESDQTISFGSNSETWYFDVDTNIYTKINPTFSPSGRLGGAAVYNPNDDKIILFGGTVSYSSGMNDLWVFDFNEMNWTELNPSLNPAPRFFSNMAFDIESDKAIIFGGGSSLNGIPKNDTWSYDLKLNSWEQQNVTNTVTSNTDTSNTDTSNTLQSSNSITESQSSESNSSNLLSMIILFPIIIYSKKKGKHGSHSINNL